MGILLSAILALISGLAVFSIIEILRGIFGYGPLAPLCKLTQRKGEE
jgi:hypothetical protein